MVLLVLQWVRSKIFHMCLGDSLWTGSPKPAQSAGHEAQSAENWKKYLESLLAGYLGNGQEPMGKKVVITLHAFVLFRKGCKVLRTSPLSDQPIESFQTHFLGRDRKNIKVEMALGTRLWVIWTAFTCRLYIKSCSWEGFD